MPANENILGFARPENSDPESCFVAHFGMTAHQMNDQMKLFRAFARLQRTIDTWQIQLKKWRREISKAGVWAKPSLLTAFDDLRSQLRTVKKARMYLIQSSDIDFYLLNEANEYRSLNTRPALNPGSRFVKGYRRRIPVSTVMGSSDPHDADEPAQEDKEE